MTDPDNIMSVSNLNIRDSKEVALARIKADMAIIVSAAVDDCMQYDDLIDVVNDIFVVEAFKRSGSKMAAAEAHGMNRGTFTKMMKKALERGASNV